MCVFARKKLFAYRVVLLTLFGTAILSFFVWAHHQFIAGIDPRMANVFTVTTVLISIPLAELCFVYIATLYGGSITLTTPMLWALAFIAEFLIGGVTGIYLGASGTDIYFHDTYFVLAHFHYTFFPIAIIGVFAGITFWYPKMFGRMMNDLVGRIHFWGTIIPFNFIPLFVLGAAGQHRRIYDYTHFPGPGDSRVSGHASVRHAVAGRDAVLPGRVPAELLRQLVERCAGPAEPLEVEYARVDSSFAAAARELRGAPERLSRTVRVRRPRSRG